MEALLSQASACAAKGSVPFYFINASCLAALSLGYGARDLSAVAWHTLGWSMHQF